ncbi:MAG: RIP metalloprotease RseP [Bacteroidales bacterium]|nr:RIP metalloprotease RseP [Bacteroidales bacterium]
METFIRIAQLLLSLSILVILHESGHFFFAKLFKTRVEKFYLFFDPWFSLFKFKKGDTEYGIGWLPLGGYVKISGMIDESMDKEQMKQPPQPWEFRSKPAGQRLLIMLGGILVNILLAFFIYIMVLWTWGEEYLPTQNASYGIMVDSVGEELGLQNGDKILSIDHQIVENFRKIPVVILLNNPKTIEVERNGQTIEIPVNKELIPKLLKDPGFITVRIPYIIGKVLKGKPAAEAGFLVGDKILKINGEPKIFADEVMNKIKEHKNQQITISVLRNGETKDIPVTVGEDGLIGVQIEGDISQFFELKKINYSFFAAIPAGIHKTVEVGKSYLRQLKLIFSPSTGAYKSVGGFIAIGKIFPGVWDWQSFWGLTAFLSIMLAILNLLPIPALDGGHVMFLLYEIITGKKPGDKFMERAQIAGLIILLALVVFANGNDIFKLFH